MAEHTLETIIMLRYGTYDEWMNSDVILQVGEAAICAFPNNRILEGMTNNRPENTPPAIGIKIGDGEHYFYELPWVQAIAADVYNWAKSANKPTYSAQEISGLQAYIEQHASGGGGSGGGTVASRAYQIVHGEDEDENKYYLRYRDEDSGGNWIVDTSSYINLQDLVDVVNWIGRTNLEDYPSLIIRTAEQTSYIIGLLDVEDSAQDNQFVTSVSQENGLITVSRARPTFSDISGYATTRQGGTGRNELTEDTVLVGNGTDPVRMVPIGDSLENNNNFVTSGVIKRYVDIATSGLTGAMHFIGEAGVVITDNSSVDPRISGYIFSQAQPGDVILYEQKEYVWTGISWRLLGDEGSYAIKGSIRDADIDEEANIAQSKIAGLEASFDEKVDKVEGKMLSSNDYTDEEKNKLRDIEENAQANIIEHILLNGNEVRATTIDGTEKSVNLTVREFSESAESKLEGIEAGAQVNIIEHIIYNGDELTPNSNKTVTISPDPHTEHENVIEHIFVNDSEITPREINSLPKSININIDEEALHLRVIKGATIPDGHGQREDIDVDAATNKLKFGRIAVTEDVEDLKQQQDTYIILNCGNSVDVMD